MPSQTFFNLPDEKQEALIEVALDEFSKSDYGSASISRIVRETGIAKGSFYQYFQDKKDLYVYLLNLVSEAKLALVRQTSPLQAKMDFYEYLSWLFDLSIEFDRVHPILSQLAYRAFYGNSSFQDPEIDKMKKAFADFVRQLVTKGIESGDINADVDLEMAVFVVDTLTDAFNNKYIPKITGITADVLAEQGSSSFEIESVRKSFNELIQILKFGLSSQ